MLFRSFRTDPDLRPPLSTLASGLPPSVAPPSSPSSTRPPPFPPCRASPAAAQEAYLGFLLKEELCRREVRGENSKDLGERGTRYSVQIESSTIARPAEWSELKNHLDLRTTTARRRRRRQGTQPNQETAGVATIPFLSSHELAARSCEPHSLLHSSLLELVPPRVLYERSISKRQPCE